MRSVTKFDGSEDNLANWTMAMKADQFYTLDPADYDATKVASTTYFTYTG